MIRFRQVEFDRTILRPLYTGTELNRALTTDRVHLNADGIERYRQLLQSLLN